LVLLEAMASGMPVVTTESCGMTDLIEDGHDGLFVIPGNSESLTSAILRLCQDGELRRRLGSCAHEKMRRYTWAQSARRHEFVFQRALGLAPEFSQESVSSAPEKKELTQANQ
jgi:glycogen synthase